MLESDDTGLLEVRPQHRRDAPLELTRGRDLIIGPHWPCSDAVAVFDRHSGDFWIIAAMGAEVLRHLAEAGTDTSDNMARCLPTAKTFFDATAATEGVVASLVEYDLVRPAHVLDLQAPQA